MVKSFKNGKIEKKNRKNILNAGFELSPVKLRAVTLLIAIYNNSLWIDSFGKFCLKDISLDHMNLTRFEFSATAA